MQCRTLHATCQRTPRHTAQRVQTHAMGSHLLKPDCTSMMCTKSAASATAHKWPSGEKRIDLGAAMQERTMPTAQPGLLRSQSRTVVSCTPRLSRPGRGSHHHGPLCWRVPSMHCSQRCNGLHPGGCRGKDPWTQHPPGSKPLQGTAQPRSSPSSGPTQCCRHGVPAFTVTGLAQH